MQKVTSTRARRKARVLAPGLVALVVGLGVLAPVAAQAAPATTEAVLVDATAQASGMLRSASIADRLQGGETLFTDEQLVSPDGTKRFVVQGDGNAVVYDEGGRALWNTQRSSAGSRIVMQGDGNLVLYTASGSATWNSGTFNRPGAYAVMQSDGNLVIYSDGAAVWNSFAASAPVVPPKPVVTDTLGSGGSLGGRASLINGSKTAVLQADGNFVVYSSGQALWSTHTSSGRRLVMQVDGNAVLYTTSGRAAWNSGTAGHPGARLVMQSDGNLVIYSTSNRALWNSFAAARPAPAPAPAPGPGVYYANCTAAWNAGAAPIHAGQPGYRPPLDRNSDGVACEYDPR